MSHLAVTKKPRYSHHSNVNLKPTAVLDHLKIKVKRRCSSHRQTIDENDDTDDESHEIRQRRQRRTKSNDKTQRRRKTRSIHIDSQEAQTKFCLNGIEIGNSTDTSDEYPVVVDNRSIPAMITKTATTEEIDLTNNHRVHAESLSTIPRASTQISTNISSSLPSCHFSVSSFNIEKESNDYPLTCPCENHLSRMYVDQSVSLSFETIYQNTFEDNDFSRAYHDSQKLIDFTYGEWKINPETNKRERLVTYKTMTQSILGSNMLTCSEKQVIDVEKAGVYVVNTEVFNEGMKYTDAFYVATKFCMIQQAPERTLLRVSAEVRYVKNVNSIARAFIDKNANSSIENGIMNYIRRIENYQTKETFSSIKKRSYEKKKENKHRREKKVDQSISIDETINVNQSFLLNIGIFIGVFLLLVHIYLCYKLYAIDRVLHPSQPSCFERCQQSCSFDSTTTNL